MTTTHVGRPRPPVLTISRDELRDKLARHDGFKLVMASSDWAFRTKHIAGSLHFPTLDKMVNDLGKDDDIVIYCSNLDCHASLAAYQALVDHGHEHVRHYAGGLIDWESAGLPLEGEWASPPPSQPVRPA